MATRYRILLAKRAASDLQAIFDHIAKDSVRNAARTVALFASWRQILLPKNRRWLTQKNPAGGHPAGFNSI